MTDYFPLRQVMRRPWLLLYLSLFIVNVVGISCFWRALMVLNQRQLILDEFTEILLHWDLICLVSNWRFTWKILLRRDLRWQDSIGVLAEGLELE